MQSKTRKCRAGILDAEDSLHSTSLLLADAHIGGWIHRERSSATEQTGSGPRTNPCRGMERPGSESTICPSPRIGACCRMVRSDQATKHVARVKEELPACLTITAVTALGRWREPFSSERDVFSTDQEKEQNEQDVREEDRRSERRGGSPEPPRVGIPPRNGSNNVDALSRSFELTRDQTGSMSNPALSLSKPSSKMPHRPQ